MKKYSLYLHEEIIETLKCFGELNEVINRLFEDTINNGMLYESTFENAPPREGARRIDAWIKTDIVSQLSRVRVRTAIYWFVENEVYSELGWKMKNGYGLDRKLRIEKQFNRAIAELTKLNRMTNLYDEQIKAIERIHYETK